MLEVYEKQLINDSNKEPEVFDKLFNLYKYHIVSILFFNYFQFL